MSLGRLILALALVTIIVAATHSYLWLRLIHDLQLPGLYETVASGILASLAASIPLAFLAQEYFPRRLSKFFAWVGFGWTGAFFLILTFLVPLELLRFVVSFAIEPLEPASHALASRFVAGFVLLSVAAITSYAIRAALGPIRVRRLTLTIPKLPAAFDGFRIVQLTDIHVGPTIGSERINEIIKKTEQLSPDLVTITGDLVDGSVEDLGPIVAPLQTLSATHGSIFVTGNHEFYSGAEPWMEFVDQLGIKVLRNERVTIEIDGAHLDIAGVHDWDAAPFGHAPNLDAALDGLPEGRQVVLLAHQPRQIHEAAERGVALQLSGHTHGGQIHPFSYLVRFQQPFVRGLHKVKDTLLYISPGTGYWGPPMRLGSRSEISEIILKSGSAETAA